MSSAQQATSNSKIASIAVALQGRFALVKEFDSLSLIYILSADCLLNPGSERLTPYDIQVTACVYSRSSASSYNLSSSWKTFVAYDIVATFPSPFHPSVAARQQTLLVSASWQTAIQAFESRAIAMGGAESLPSVFADSRALESLSNASRPCAGRRESYTSSSSLSVPRISLGH